MLKFVNHSHVIAEISPSHSHPVLEFEHESFSFGVGIDTGVDNLLSVRHIRAG
jgi:hypothetical protein